MVPQRSCTGCGAKKPKPDLLRLARTPGGQVVVDERMRLGGRGAYVCRDPGCWEIGVRKGRVDRTLRTATAGQARKELMERLETAARYTMRVRN